MLFGITNIFTFKVFQTKTMQIMQININVNIRDNNKFIITVLSIWMCIYLMQNVLISQ